MQLKSSVDNLAGAVQSLVTVVTYLVEYLGEAHGPETNDFDAHSESYGPSQPSEPGELIPTPTSLVPTDDAVPLRSHGTGCGGSTTSMLSPVAPTSVAPQKLSERIVVDSEAASEFKKIIEEIETFEETYQDQKVDGLDEPGVPDRSQDDDVSDNYDLPTPERFLPHVLTPCQPSVSTSATEPPSNHVAERQEDPEVQTYLPKMSERSWVSCSDQ